MAFTSGSPSAGQLEIGIALVLQDRFSNQAREASSVIRGLHRDAKNAVQANLTAVQAYTNMFGGIASNIVSSLATTITTGADFIDMMTSVGAISGATNEPDVWIIRNCPDIRFEDHVHVKRYSFRYEILSNGW